MVKILKVWFLYDFYLTEHCYQNNNIWSSTNANYSFKKFFQTIPTTFLYNMSFDHYAHFFKVIIPIGSKLTSLKIEPAIGLIV